MSKPDMKDLMQYLTIELISYPFINANTKGENGLQFLNLPAGSHSTINGVTFSRAIRDNMKSLGSKTWRTSNTTDSSSGYGYGAGNHTSMADAAEDLRDPISKKYSQFLYDDTPHRGLMIAESGEAAADRALSPEEQAEAKALKTQTSAINKIKKALKAAKDNDTKQDLQKKIDELEKTKAELKAKVDRHPKGEKLEPVKFRGLTQLSPGISATAYPDDERVFCQGTKADGTMTLFSYMRHFSRYIHCETMDVKNLMKRPSCIKNWLLALRGMQLGGGHASNLSEFVPEAIVWRFHNVAGQGFLFLTPEDTKGWSPDSKIDLTPLYRKLENVGITNVNVGGTETLRDGVVVKGLPIDKCLDMIFDEINRMWG